MPLYTQLKVYFIIFYAFSSVSAVSGNVLLLIVLGRFSQFRRRTFVFIGNLAVSDLLVGMVVIPYKIVYHSTGGLGHYKYTCLLRLTIGIMLVGASIWNLFSMSLDRYLTTVYTMKCVRLSTKQRLIFLISMCWITAISTGLLPILGWNKWYLGTRCFIYFVLPVPYILIVFIMYFLLVVLNFIIYARVAQIVLSRRPTLRSLESRMRYEHRMSKLRLMVALNGSFVICWGPLLIIGIIGMLNLMVGSVTSNVVVLADFMATLNPTVNWLISYFVNTKIRTAVNQTLRCTPRHRH